MNIGTCVEKGLLKTRWGFLRAAVLLCVISGLGLLPEVGYAGLGSTTIADIAKGAKHSTGTTLAKRHKAAVKHRAASKRRPAAVRSQKRSEGRTLARRAGVAKQAVAKPKNNKTTRIRSVRPRSQRKISRPAVRVDRAAGQGNTKQRIRKVVWLKPIRPSAETIFARYLSAAENELKSHGYLKLSTAQEFADAAKRRISPITGAVAANNTADLIRLATGIKLAERAASLDPNLSDAHMWQVQGYVHARCEASALRISEAAVKRFPDDQYFKNTISRIRRFRACR